MSAVAVGIVDAPLSGKVPAYDHATVLAAIKKCRVTEVNSGIEYRDADSGAIQTFSVGPIGHTDGVGSRR